MLTISSLFIIAAAVTAPSWEESFEPQAVATYLDRQNAAAMVLIGGERTANVQRAEQALVAALRAGGQTRLVMTGESVTVSPQDTDEAIIKKARNLPIDLICVLRVFPGGGPSAPEVAVVTVYDQTGASLTAMAATQGQVLPPRESTSRQSAGRDAVAAALENPKSKKETKKREPVDPRKITFAAGVLVDVKDGRPISSWVSLYMAGKPLSGSGLYDVLGRTDLASTYRSRMAAKTMLYIAGGGLLLGGAIGFVAGLASPCAIYDKASYTCTQKQFDFVIPGLALAGAGTAALIVAAVINPHPVSPREAIELAQEYNEKLDAPKKSDAKETQVTKTSLSWSVGLAPTPHGVSAGFHLTF